MSPVVSAIDREVTAVTAVTKRGTAVIVAPPPPRLSWRRYQHPLSRQHLLRRCLARTHAVRDTNPAISIPGQGQARPLLQQALDSLQPLQMTHDVLRHRPPPSVYA